MKEITACRTARDLRLEGYTRNELESYFAADELQNAGYGNFNQKKGWYMTVFRSDQKKKMVLIIEITVIFPLLSLLVRMAMDLIHSFCILCVPLKKPSHEIWAKCDPVLSLLSVGLQTGAQSGNTPT